MKEEVGSISVERMFWWDEWPWGGMYLSCLGKIRRSITYRTKWGRAWWKLWFKNHRDQSEFWILFQIWQGVISRFWAKEWSGQSYVLMGSILLPNEKYIIEGQGWTQRDWRSVQWKGNLRSLRTQEMLELTRTAHRLNMECLASVRSFWNLV